MMCMLEMCDVYEEDNFFFAKHASAIIPDALWGLLGPLKFKDINIIK